MGGEEGGKGESEVGRGGGRACRDPPGEQLGNLQTHTLATGLRVCNVHVACGGASPSLVLGGARCYGGRSAAARFRLRCNARPSWRHDGGLGKLLARSAREGRHAGVAVLAASVRASVCVGTPAQRPLAVCKSVRRRVALRGACGALPVGDRCKVIQLWEQNQGYGSLPVLLSTFTAPRYWDGRRVVCV